MNPKPDSPDEVPNSNADPLTGEAGAHPVATGIGAAAVGSAGLAASAMVAGPIGLAAALVGGAVIGGYVGKAAGEIIDPTAEEAFWREEHPRQPYVKPGESDDDYFKAYRVGYVGYSLLNGDEHTFEESEAELRKTYELIGAGLAWERARTASRAAWDRLRRRNEVKNASATSESQSAVHETILGENLQSGALSNAQMPR